MIDIEESYLQADRPRNDKPVKLALQFKGVDGMRSFGQNLNVFFTMVRQQFGATSIKTSSRAVLCCRKQICELMYQPTVSLEESRSRQCGVFHKFSMTPCVAKSDIKGNDHTDKNALWLEVDLMDLSLASQHLSKVNINRYAINHPQYATRTGRRDQQTPNETVAQANSRAIDAGTHQSFRLTLTRKRPNNDTMPPFLRFILENENNTFWVQTSPLKYSLGDDCANSTFSYATTALLDRDISFYANSYNFKLLEDSPWCFQFNQAQCWNFLDNIKYFQEKIPTSSGHCYQIVFGKHPNDIIVGSVGEEWQTRRFISKFPPGSIDYVELSSQNVRDAKFSSRVTVERIAEREKHTTSYRTIILNSRQIKSLKQACDHVQKALQTKIVLILHEIFLGVLLPTNSSIQDFSLVFFESCAVARDVSVCPREYLFTTNKASKERAAADAAQPQQ